MPKENSKPSQSSSRPKPDTTTHAPIRITQKQKLPPNQSQSKGK
jgi:hypothetical protein